MFPQAFSVSYCYTDETPMTDQLIGRWLSAFEQKQMQKYLRPQRQWQYLAGRIALKKNILQKNILQLTPESYDSLTPQNIEICPDSKALSKKPYIWVQGTKNTGSEISISHSGDIACAALSSKSIGIDIELIQTRSIYFYDDVLLAEELKYLLSLNPEDKHTIGTVYWTAKEAMSKVIGKGLTLPFANLKVDLPSGFSVSENWVPFSGTVVSDGQPIPFQLWSQILFKNNEYYIVTVAAVSTAAAISKESSL